MWSMSDEMTFIDHIGNWTGNKGPLTVETKLQLLKGYLEGLSHRTVWVNLNQQELEAYAKREIARYSILQPSSII